MKTTLISNCELKSYDQRQTFWGIFAIFNFVIVICYCTPRTGGSVVRASGCHAGGREFDSGRTNTQGLKITEENVLSL